MRASSGLISIYDCHSFPPLIRLSATLGSLEFEMKNMKQDDNNEKELKIRALSKVRIITLIVEIIIIKKNSRKQ